MAEQLDESRAVSVTNISPTANEKTVSDFFSFCGKISKLYMNKDRPDSNGGFSAVVQFETESAAKTALLLTNALIVDRPITVVPYTGSTTAPGDTSTTGSAASPSTTATTETPALGTPVDQSNITQRDFHGIADEQRTKTSVVASLMAAGYVLASNALDHAKEYDDKHNISLQAKVAVEQIKVKAHEIDQAYHISEKVQQAKTQIVEKGKQLDESYHLTEKAQQVKASATATAQTVAANPTVAKTVSTAKTYASMISASATAMYNDYKEETQKAIEEKKRQQGQGTITAASNPASETPSETVTEGMANMSTAEDNNNNTNQPATTTTSSSTQPTTTTSTTPQ